jgi:signal transduction histidine kinase
MMVSRFLISMGSQSHRRLLLFAALTVAAGIVLLLFQWRESDISGTRRLRASNAQRTALALLVSVLNLRSAELELAVTGDQRYRQAARALLPRIEFELSRLDEDSADIRELREVLGSKLADSRRLVSSGQNSTMTSDIDDQRMARIRALCESISDRYLEIRNTEANRQQSAMLWNHVVLVGVSVVVLALLLTATFRIDKLLQKLAFERDRYQRLAEHLDRVREDERASLARELHDDIGQTLTALKLALASLAQQLDPDGRRTIGAATRTIDEAIQKTRNVCTMLHPPVLDQLGIIASIEWLTREFRERTGLPCAFRSTTEEPAGLGQEQKLALFRITQEALTNAARHAQADSVLVTAYQQSGTLVIEIQDTGTGFNPGTAERSNTFGLPGMQERARLIGAGLELDSEPGQGTSVRVRIPIKESVAVEHSGS